MNCKKVTEELVFLFADEAEGQGHELLIAYREHVSHCPHCANRAQITRRVLTIVRERAVRRQAPTDLRERILAKMARQIAEV
jgi:anti-sigma factor (TIGR02949 family)